MADKYDGSIVLPVKIDTKGFEKDLKKIEKSNVYEVEIDGRIIPIYDNTSSAEIEKDIKKQVGDMAELEKVQQEIFEIEKQRRKIEKELQKIKEDEHVELWKRDKPLVASDYEGDSIDFKEWTQAVKITDYKDTIQLTDEQIKRREELNNKYEELGKILSDLKRKEDDLTPTYEGKPFTDYLTSAGTVDYDKLISDETKETVNEVAEKTNYMVNNGKQLVPIVKEASDETEELGDNAEKAKNKFDFTDKAKGVERSIERATKKVMRMGMAMIGIRSLYGTIAGSVNRITEQNPQLQAEIQAIKNTIDNIVLRLVQVLLPVIETIVAFVAIIMQDLFGIDIFANNFSKSMKSAVGSAQKLRKQLMGFDEMNILNKDGTTGVGGIGGGKVESLNTSEFDKSIQSIKDKIKEIKDAWQDFKDGLIDKGETALDASANFIYEHTLGPLERLYARFVDFTGVDPLGMFSKEEKPNAKKVTYDKIEPVNNEAYSSSLDQVEKDTGKAVEQTVTIMEKGQKRVLKVQQKTAKNSSSVVNKSYANAVDVLKNATVRMEEGYYYVETTAGQTFRMTEYEYNEMIKQLQNGTLKYESLTSHACSNIDSKVKNTTDNISNYSTNTNDKVKTDVEGTEEVIDDSTVDTRSAFERMGDVVKKIFGVDLPDSAKEGTKNATGEIKNETNNYNKNPAKATVEVQQDSKQNSTTVTNDIKNKIKNPFKATVQAVLDTTGMMKTLKAFAKSWPMAFQPIVSALEKQGYHAAKGAVIGFARGGVINLPRLAPGGIINRPGRGVPLGVGGAIGGERGREAVIPLTDSQQMALLGREIAKNVIINLTSVLDVDGKQLARVTAQVMNDMNFASNGGVI